MTAQTARALHDDAPRLIHHCGDFQPRQVRHGFDVRLQRFLLAARQQPLAQPPETPSIRIRALAHFFEMPVLIEVEIQPVIKPRGHQAKGESDQRSGKADGRRETHFPASFGKSFRKASRSVSGTQGRTPQFNSAPATDRLRVITRDAMQAAEEKPGWRNWQTRQT